MLFPLYSFSGGNSLPLPLHDHHFSIKADPQLVGPENLCIVFGGVVGTFSGGGNPGDVYNWLVTDSAGKAIFARTGGAQLETIQVVFSEVGSYTVQLSVRRGTNPAYYQNQLTVTVQQGPELALLPDYLLCAGSPTLLTALDPATSNLSEFTIEWKDVTGNLLGTGNNYLSYSEGYHLVELYQTDATGKTTCLIIGTTFVGPPIDFKIISSSTSICEGESIQIGLDTPISGDWFIQKEFTGSRSPVSTGFEIEFEASELSGPGLYLVTFQTTNEQYPDCISERIIGFELVESPKITPAILALPDNCTDQNGSFQITVETDVDALYIPELNVIEGPLNAGVQLIYTNLEPNVYSLVVEKTGCQITQLLTLNADNLPIPPSQQLPNISVVNETCSNNGVNTGSVSLDFGAPISTGEFRILVEGKGEILKGSIPPSGQTTIDLINGTYLLEINADGCTYPVETVTIEEAPQAEFTIPADLNICETFSLSPVTDQNLKFTLTFPDGSFETIATGESFTLTDAGAYSILGEGTNPSLGLCQKRIDFNATLSSTITFTPFLAVEKCFDPIKYEIDLKGISTEEASIRWFNDRDEIVGRGPTFYPPNVGFYSLLVQPLQSGFCPVSPAIFEVVAPITSVPMELKAEKICPQPSSSTITLKTNEEEVTDTEWIYYDLQDNMQELTTFDGLLEIEVNKPGTYEVVVYSKLGCEIGRNLVPVEESQLLTPPVLEETYGVCTKGKTGPKLDPGDFSEYYWQLEDQLISEDSVFTPKEAGNYTLKVITVDGCEFFTSFRTYDACSFDYVIPTGMVLGDPERNFEVRISEGITEIELYIINRQGSLVHYQKSEEIPFGEAFLEWDGTINGSFISPGTYVVVLVGRNPLFQYEEKITGSLLVLE
ncbi:hypothetical protein [Algoriphagus sp. A40]|uniref:hypothetical protein n=1 Tax=Algoriphagus sp. A40 TaxID=1945863 RepID=UPI001115747F|nr:hypothetical protein [Algoriphagus sp. A40]